MQNPIPGTNWKNCGGYDGDSGLDILVPMGTPVYAAANGVIEYAERGHTPWGTSTNIGVDTPNSIRIRLAEPLRFNGEVYPWIWYTHLQGIDPSWRDRYDVPVRAGALLGHTGLGNRVPHLHFGVLEDQAQESTMHWRQVAELIWGPRGGKPQTPVAEPIHGIVHTLKVFDNPKGQRVFLDGKEFRLVGAKNHGAPIGNLDLLIRFKEDKS